MYNVKYGNSGFGDDGLLKRVQSSDLKQVWGELSKGHSKKHEESDYPPRQQLD